MAKMLQADAASRREAPRSAAPGEKRVVSTPGMSNYLESLSNLGFIIRAKNGGNIREAASATPAAVRRMHSYLAARGGVGVDYVSPPPKNLAKAAIEYKRANDNTSEDLKRTQEKIQVFECVAFRPLRFGCQLYQRSG